MIGPPDASFCRACCVPVSVAGVPAAIVLPEITGYPEDKIELIAALHLRDHLALAEGDSVRVEPAQPIAAKAVLFDLDGTLVDSIGAYFAIAHQAAKSHGLTVTEAHVRRALSSGASFWEEVVPRERSDRKDLKRLLSAEAAKHWPAALERNARVFPGVPGLLDELRGLGIALGIVSGARPEVMALLRAEGLDRRFDAIVLGEDVARKKPNPEGILKCLDRMGVAPADAVYVGDTPIDMQASRAAGTRPVGVLSGAADGAELSRHAPARLIASLDRLRAILAPAHRL